MSTLNYKRTQKPFPAAELPEVIIDAHPEFIELNRVAWRQAWDHVRETTALPGSPFMSEGCEVNKVWLWDSCFMGMFCRYAIGAFPGRNTLDNLYHLLENGPDQPIVLHHRDNPPLFAWIEWQYYEMDKNLARLREVLPRLVRHYDYLENVEPAKEHNQWQPDITWKREAGGYCWGGIQSGMDNTPRGRDDYASIHWVDALAQQALAARWIARIAQELGDAATRARFEREYEEKKALLATYWDEEANAFLNKYRDGSGFCRVLTPASYWPLFAGCATSEQAARTIPHLEDPNKLGGWFPFPSVARDDPAFSPVGTYWRGSIWLPVAYMGVKAVGMYGRHDLAARLAFDILSAQVRCYHDFEPHTIWECYSPTAHKPGTAKAGQYSRPDFCGWSALGPISLLMENIIGVHRISALEGVVEWLPGVPEGRLGLKNLRFGDNVADLIRENDGTVRIRAAKPFRLVYKGTAHDCPAGVTVI